MDEILHTWRFSCHKITVKERPFDHDRHSFEIYKNNKRLGVIYPDNTADSASCRKKLNQGNCPICHSWEDGLGNTVSIGGWGGQTK